MDRDIRLNLHISIQKRLSLPPLEKCINCCFPPRFHCPFCPPTSFKPSKFSKLRLHLQNHRHRAVNVGEYTVHRCGLQCRAHPHYHCLYCVGTLIRKRDFISHVQTCRLEQQQRVKVFPDLLTEQEGLFVPLVSPRQSDVLSYPTDTGADCNTTLESEEENSPGTSGNQSVTDPSKCHRTVQTLNFEKPQDCDEFYFMGLVKTFKKLSPHKKADVRMKIERLLFEAEFE